MKITINGKPHDLDRASLSYGDIAELAGKPWDFHLTVTYDLHRGNARRAGTLRPSEYVNIEDGMHITAVRTDNA